MEKDKTNETGSDGSEQKSGKSPQELMQQVSQADDSLDSSTKKSAVDAMAEESANLGGQAAQKKPETKGGIIKKITSLFNIYLLIFLLLLVVSAGVVAVSYLQNKREAEPGLETTKLTEDALEELKTSDTVVGDPRQILTIESHAVISGKVVLRDTLDVAGGVNIGGPLNITSIQAAEAGNFNSIATNDLQAAGNVAIGDLLDVAGQVTIGRDLAVAGKITAGTGLEIAGEATVAGNFTVIGTLSTQNLSVASFSFGHIDSSGGLPGVTAGGAAGSPGTVNISGTDLAGTVVVNTGGGTSPGTLATVSFATAYSSPSPHVVITPSNSACAAINYYVTSVSASQFAIATTNAPPASSTCRFNYIVIN